MLRTDNDSPGKLYRESRETTGLSVEDGKIAKLFTSDAGGLTVVQTPETARSPQMVISALKLRQADYVLPLEEIAALLSALPTAAAAVPRTS